MNEDQLLKKIQQLIKEEIRPIKDIAELTKKKVDSHDIFLHSTVENVRSIKELQSLMNEKLDQHTESLINIEHTNKIYGDMYKLNNDNMKRLKRRIEKLEDSAGIEPQPEDTLAALQ